MATHRSRITEGGRLVIPAEMRRTLGLQPGAEVLLDIEAGELRIRSVAQAIAQAQAAVRRYIPADARLADELIQERRQDAARD